MRIDHDLAVGDQADGRAVGLGARDRLGGEVAVRADLVLHHHRLAERRREPLGEDARRDVRRAAGRDRHVEVDRPGGVLRRCADGEDGREEKKRELHGE